MYNVRDVCR